MLDIKKRLPQLDPLISFEAAARHASFAQAARELNVTPSAVSQQIRTLEDQLGVPLFVRGHRSVELTDRGKEFQNSVSVALMHLGNAANEVRSSDKQRPLEIATDTSIAAMWLMPRLKKFEALYPDVPIRLTVSDVESELFSSAFQIALVHGKGGWRGYESSLLFAEEIFPVCAPSYLEMWAGPFTSADLAHWHLLDLEYEQWFWMNWAIWLTELNLPLPETQRKLRMNNYPLIIDAAKQGLGVALGWQHLLDEELASGALIRPVQDIVKTDFAYHVVWPFNEELPPVAIAFKDWVFEEFGTQAT